MATTNSLPSRCAASSRGTSTPAAASTRARRSALSSPERRKSPNSSRGCPWARTRRTSTCPRSGTTSSASSLSARRPRAWTATPGSTWFSRRGTGSCGGSSRRDSAGGARLVRRRDLLERNRPGRVRLDHPHAHVEHGPKILPIYGRADETPVFASPEQVEEALLRRLTVNLGPGHELPPVLALPRRDPVRAQRRAAAPDQRRAVEQLLLHLVRDEPRDHAPHRVHLVGALELLGQDRQQALGLLLVATREAQALAASAAYVDVEHCARVDAVDELARELVGERRRLVIGQRPLFAPATAGGPVFEERDPRHAAPDARDARPDDQPTDHRERERKDDILPGRPAGPTLDHERSGKPKEHERQPQHDQDRGHDPVGDAVTSGADQAAELGMAFGGFGHGVEEIGRASCRERV